MDITQQFIISTLANRDFWSKYSTILPTPSSDMFVEDFISNFNDFNWTKQGIWVIIETEVERPYITRVDWRHTLKDNLKTKID